MPIPWPKILTSVTVPTGGWDLDFVVSKAGSLDTSLTATVAAGTYYLAWDYQDDCLLYALNKAIVDALIAEGMPNDQRPANIYLDSDNKVNIHFCGDGFAGTENDVELTWTTSSNALAAALGFDTDDVQITDTDQPIFTADWQHGYGWYAEEDGQLVSLRVEDHRVTQTSQTISYAGWVASQQIGQRYVNELELDWLLRELTFSKGIAYGEASLHPYDRNRGLECWWEEAAKGTQFRVYRDGRTQYTGGAIHRGLALDADTDWIENSTILWDIEPQEHKGRLAQTTLNGTDTVQTDARFFINSNTQQRLFAPNTTVAGALASFAGAGEEYWILDQRYGTYVLDLRGMRRFEPVERPQIDRYGITIPLLRYES